MPDRAEQNPSIVAVPVQLWAGAQRLSINPQARQIMLDSRHRRWPAFEAVIQSPSTSVFILLPHFVGSPPGDFRIRCTKRREDSR